MSFLTQLNWRYATKVFDTEKKISDEQLSQITEAIRMSPTSYGLQPFHVVVVTNPELRAQLKGAAYGQPQVTDASHLLVFCGRTDLLPRVDQYIDTMSGGNKEVVEKLEGFKGMMIGAISGMDEVHQNEWAKRQAYITLGFGLAAAAELGVDSCPMEGFSPDEFKSILNLPSHIHPAALLALGFRKDPETPAKTRFPYDEIFEHRS